MTTTTTSGAAIQRYKIGYHSDEWGVRSSTPSGIRDDAGPWVRYEDHAAVITALRAQQPTTAQVAPASVLHLVHSAFAEIAMAFPKAFALHKVGIADTAVREALAAPAAVAGTSLQHIHDLLYTAQRTTGDAQAQAIAEARIALSDLMTAPEPVLATRAWPKVSGVSRDEGHPRALLVFFSAEPTDDEMRAVHGTLAAAPTTQPAPQPSPAAQGDALSDDAVRVPLDNLHADAAYLIGRLREGSMPYARAIEIIRERIDAAKAAIRARAAQEGKSHE